MKRSFILLASALLSCSAFAEVLTPDAALSRAFDSTSSRRVKALKSNNLSLVKTISSDSLPAVYLFGRNNGSLVVLSADDATDAVLGICDDGEVDINNLPPAMKAMLDSYADQIAFLRKHPSTVKSSAKAKTERAYIEPMCKTLWSQDAPYNNSCPEVKSGTSYVSTPTGCVATCLAQILKVFNYPKQGEGEYSYSWNDDELSFDFDNYEFDWDNMLNDYSDDESNDVQQDAVAQLMYACGVVVDMNYASGGSGAWPINLLTTGPKYLKLDKGIRYYNRNYYGINEWNDLIYDALKNSGPIMYNGTYYQTDALYYAHEFVCDGYLSDDLFHINWGWGKGYNGYYRLSALNTENAGYNTTSYCYNYYQDAVCYIQPPVENSKVFAQMYCDNFIVATMSQNLGSTISISSSLLNYSAEPLSGVLGIKICDQQGNLVRYVGSYQFSNVALKSSTGSYTVLLPKDLAEGTYTVTPAFKADGDDWKDANVSPSAVRAYTMTVSGSKATFKSVGKGSISISDFTLDTPIYVNSLFGVSAKITNTSNSDYSGQIALALVKNNSGTRTTYTNSYYVPLYVPAGETIDFTYNDMFTKGSAKANYEIAFIDASGNYISDFIPAKITADSPTYSITVECPVIENVDNVDKYQIKATFEVTCTEGYFNKHFWFSIFGVDDNNQAVSPSLGDFGSDYITLTEGETKTVSVHGELPNAKPGEVYKAYVVANQEYLKNKADKYSATYFTIGNPAGVQDVTADESVVVATQYYNLQGVNLGENVTRPGLYIKEETLANGQHRASRIFVKQ